MKIRYVFGFLFLFITTLSSLTAFSAYGDDNDLDNDGVPNEQDLCPKYKETFNKYQDEDGCPDVAPEERVGGIPDLDKDGIPDNFDSCPSRAETYNGILDLDGCPDDYISSYDFDSDGLPDAIDACPEAPETYNRYQDEDGCPDEVPVGQ